MKWMIHFHIKINTNNFNGTMKYNFHTLVYVHRRIILLILMGVFTNVLHCFHFINEWWKNGHFSGFKQTMKHTGSVTFLVTSPRHLPRQMPVFPVDIFWTMKKLLRLIWGEEKDISYGSLILVCMLLLINSYTGLYTFLFNRVQPTWYYQTVFWRK